MVESFKFKLKVDATQLLYCIFGSAGSTLSLFVTKENFMNETLVCCVARNKAETWRIMYYPNVSQFSDTF